MKKLVFSLSFCFLFYTAGQSQTFGTVTNTSIGGGGVNSAAVSYLLGDKTSADSKRKSATEDIQGSAYTSETFLPAQLYYKDEFQSNVLYRYNAYAEEIEIKDGEGAGADVRGLNRDKSIKLITVEGKEFLFSTFIDKKGLTQNGYLTKLTEGKYSLYKRFDVKYTQGQKAQNSFVKATPPRFSKFTEYYLEVEGKNRIDELELSNRKLLKLVNKDQREALKVFLKENNIKVKKEKDLYEVLVFLNN